MNRRSFFRLLALAPIATLAATSVPTPRKGPFFIGERGKESFIPITYPPINKDHVARMVETFKSLNLRERKEA